MVNFSHSFVMTELPMRNVAEMNKLVTSFGALIKLVIASFFFFCPSFDRGFFHRFYYILVKMPVLFFLITVFLLQDKDRILPFCMSTFYYGYVVPVVYLVAGFVIKFTLPRNTAEL